MPTQSIGIDTGGTFTDFVWLGDDGRLRIHKQPTTRDDPSRAVLDGMAVITGQADDDTFGGAAVIHGSTVATNALLERSGVRTALITTAGFRDVLEIGRQNRPDLYALVPRKPPPLVPREWRFEVVERVTAAGEVLRPLDEAALRPIVSRIAAEHIESVAICLLFAFLYPAHERRVGELIRAALGPDAHLSHSVDILPEYREYERTAATVINAYVAPLMSRYLSRLVVGIAPRRLSVMQSNGGVISATMAGAQAARTALSGPAGGVVGARFIAEAAEMSDIITFDMGGTSTDVALCPGRTPVTTEGEIAGLPLRLPMIDIHTVGAGGGSLAYVDAGGALNVGPQSAGADPGPACYHADYDGWRVAAGRLFPPGRATVSDANLVLGRLDAKHFLGGEMPLHEPSARRALGELAAELDLSNPEEAAWAVVRVANANMERAVRRISVERGHDPRRFALLAFGGGGPLHACELAGGMDIPVVLVPRTPGVLSALGMLAAEPTRDTSQTVMLSTAEMRPSLFAPLEARLRREMAAEGYDPARLELRRGLDMRYLGQSHELTIAVFADDGADKIRAAFHAAHTARYGYARPEAAVEVVTIRLSAVAPSLTLRLLRHESAGDDPAAAIIGRKPVWFAGGFVDAPLFNRELLRPGNFLPGPSVIYQYDTTTVIPPGWSGKVDRIENLVLSKSE